MTRRPRAVWITRTQPGAAATAERVRALGLKAIVEPLLTVRPLASVKIDLTGVGAIAFTSANAVRAFAGLSTERSLRVFTVGHATTQAAIAAGFTEVTGARSNVSALASLIAAHRPDEIVLHPAAVEPAGDLAGELEAQGVRMRTVALYETVVTPPSAVFPELLPELDFVLLHSPRAARALADWLAAHPAPKLTALCFSPAVAAPLAASPLAGVRVAEAPNDEALLAVLRQSLAR